MPALLDPAVLIEPELVIVALAPVAKMPSPSYCAVLIEPELVIVVFAPVA